MILCCEFLMARPVLIGQGRVMRPVVWRKLIRRNLIVVRRPL